MRPAEIEGVYVPSLGRVGSFGPGGDSSFQVIPGGSSVRRRIVDSMDGAFIPDMRLVPSAGIVHDRIAVELFRGCTRGAGSPGGMITRPEGAVCRECGGGDPFPDRKDRLGGSWPLSLASCDYSASPA